MNSPESVDPRRPTECYGKEAKNYMIELLQDKKVRLQLDALKPERDEYGRVLAYIWREDGLFVNQDMIERGYAYEYTYKQEKYKFQENFKSTQGKAKERAVGLWAQSTCNGKK
jgi:micrococcal nuclease